MAKSNEPGLVLNGLDGGNPLGFLAAVGTLRVLSDGGDGPADRVRLGWTATPEGWRPLLVGYGENRVDLCDALRRSLRGASDVIFDIGRVCKDKKKSNKFPFDADRLAEVLQTLSGKNSERRDADFLAGFGTELYPDARTGEFQCTGFKMVRSGDSNGQGMLLYAKAIRQKVDQRAIERTLFENWDYGDEDYSLRWDPIEDQRYALRWRDPSKSTATDGPGTMTAANCLAVEALRCMPCVVPIGTRAVTTGFQEIKRRKRFVWPIWTPCVNAETVRSLLSLGELHEAPLRRSTLEARGVQEVYGASVIRPNQYYSNFAPAQPVM